MPSIKESKDDHSTQILLGAFSVIAMYLIVGTVVFHKAEGWSVIDSFYVSGITLSTVGYGDFTPKTTMGKMVSVFFGLSGLGIIAYCAGLIGQRYFHNRSKLLEKLPKYRRYTFSEDQKENKKQAAKRNQNL